MTSTLSTPALSAQTLSLSLSRKKILSDLNFEIQKGESIAVVGHNGAGKTTFFHLIFGIKFQTSGSLSLFGIPANKTEARKKIAFVPERPYLNPHDTLEEMLQFFSRLAGVEITHTEREAVVKEVNLEKAGGANVLTQKLKTFSKGMLQRALIAQALITQPEFLILDEPMSGLDPEGREWLKGMIKKLKSQGKTIMFSTHALEDVKDLADQVLVLNQGRVEYFGAPK